MNSNVIFVPCHLYQFPPEDFISDKTKPKFHHVTFESKLLPKRKQKQQTIYLKTGLYYLTRLAFIVKTHSFQVYKTCHLVLINYEYKASHYSYIKNVMFYTLWGLVISYFAIRYLSLVETLQTVHGTQVFRGIRSLKKKKKNFSITL